MNTLSAPGMFYGIGVGPGEPGLLPFAAFQALCYADVILLPRARDAEDSAAQRAIEGLGLDVSKCREIAFEMNPDRAVLRAHYAALAADIAAELQAGRTVAYLTIGDPMTYSTYIYTLDALRARLPELPHRTFPGVPSYCALAALAGFPLGEGKERMLVLPCPDDMGELRAAIEQHDIVVLMKIGRRFREVLALLKDLGIAHLCALGKHVGMADQHIVADLTDIAPDNTLGYLSTLLIRRQPRTRRMP